MRIQRKVVTLLLILISAVLQGTLFKALSIGSIAPNLLLILTVSFGFMRGKKNGIWIGFLCGILKDLLSDGLLGFYGLIYLCIGYAAGCCCKLFYDEELRVPIILVAAGLRRSGLWNAVSDAGTHTVLLLFRKDHHSGNDLYGSYDCSSLQVTL